MSALLGCLRFGYDVVDLGHMSDAPDGPGTPTTNDAGSEQGDAGSDAIANGDAGTASPGGDSGIADSGMPQSSGSPDAGSVPEAGTRDASPADASADANTPDTPCGGTLPEAHRIDVVSSQVVAGPHADFPLLVSLTADWLRAVASGGRVIGPQGSDLRFAQDPAGQFLLNTEVEQYDSTTGTLVAWVRIPSLSSASSFYLLYGECAGLLPQPMGSVWTNYAAVWHLQDNRDATGLGNDCVEEGSVPSTAGQIGGSRAWDGAAGTLNCGSSAGIDDIFQTRGYLSLWLNANAGSSGTAGRMISKEDASAMNQYGWALFLDTTPSGSLLFEYDAFDPRGGSWASTPGSVPLGTWHSIVVQYGSGSTAEVPQFFVDGQAVALGNTTAPGGSAGSDATTTLYIGNLGNVKRSFEGSIDELRLSRNARTAGWFATEYNNQHNPSAFYTLSLP